MKIIIIILFCFASMLSFLKFRKKIFLMRFLLMGGFLFLFAAFRDGNAVRDYNNYVTAFNDPNWRNVEISFTIIVWIVKHIFFDNVLFLFVIYALIGVLLKTKAIKELTALCFLSLVIYISNFYILQELTQIRVGIAGGFLLLCIKPIYDRDFWKFLIFTGSAVFFHYSALVILPLWFLRGNSINKYFYTAIIPLVYIIYFEHINLVELLNNFIPIATFNQRYREYKLLQELEVGDFAKMNVFNLSFLARILIYYLILLKSELVYMKNRYANLLLKIEGFSLTSFILFSAMPVYASRINELFGVVEIILLPFMYYVFKPKLLSTFIVVLAGLCLLLINLFYIKLIT